MPTKLQPKRPITETEPEIFIIESLHVNDEVLEKFEGRALRDVLRLLGKKPIYCYVRDSRELKTALELFRHSSYRFLHFSMHGAPNGIATTLEFIDNVEFSTMLKGRLKNRRVFFSACELGSDKLPGLIQEGNPGMNSIAAPIKKIYFGPACAFWIALYAQLLSENFMSMNAAAITPALAKLCDFFRMPLHWSYFDPAPNAKMWRTKTVGPEDAAESPGIETPKPSKEA